MSRAGAPAPGAVGVLLGAGTVMGQRQLRQVNVTRTAIVGHGIGRSDPLWLARKRQPSVSHLVRVKDLAQ
jgi:hypothetical protein